MTVKPDIASLVNAVAACERCGPSAGQTELAQYVTPFIEQTYAGADITFYGGLAYLYARLGEHNKAPQFQQKRQVYGQQAVLLNPSDDLALAALTADEVIQVAENLIRHQCLTNAVKLLQQCQTPASALRLDVIDFFNQEKARIEKEKPSNTTPPPLLVNIIVWGSAYIQTLSQYGLASLMAPGNFPAVAAQRKIILDIYTTAEGQGIIETLPITGQLKRISDIHFNLLPDRFLNSDAAALFPEIRRWVAAGAQQCGALRAQRLGADLMFCATSCVYSDESLSAAYRHIDAGRKAVLCICPRAQESAPYAELQNFGLANPECVTISAEQLSAFTASHLHPQSRNAFLGTGGNYVEQGLVTVFFGGEDGFTCRTYQPHPVIITHDILPGGFVFDSYTADVRFLANALKDLSPDEACVFVDGPAMDIVLTDVDCGAQGAMRSYGKIDATIESCVGGVLHTVVDATDIDFYTWALHQKTMFTGGVSGALPKSKQSETDLMAEVFSQIGAGAGASIERAKFYQRLPG